MRFSKIGFGGYRIDHRVEEHYKSLYKALINGINLIDTSANYSDGGSEILIGNVISDALTEDKIKREDITLVTKGGYIQGQNYKFASKKKEQGAPFKDVVEHSEGLWHCISPDFLEDQINRQLFRLDQVTFGGYIDVYLLHNPEYYLQWAREKRIKTAKDEYYSRIKKAFEFLEEKVKEGKIKAYGISSNTFPGKSTKDDFTSLEKVIKIANEVSVRNNFKFAEMPFNLIESNALFEKNQCGGTKTVLQVAKENDIRVLINRPLNAITSKGIVRLADFPCNSFSEKDFLKQVSLVTMTEDDFLNEKLRKYDISEEDFKKLSSALVSGKMIGENWKDFGSIEHLNDVIENHFVPRINFLYDFFDMNFSGENNTPTEPREFFYKYIKEVYRLLNFVTNRYKEKANTRSRFLHSLIDEFAEDEFKKLSLSQKAVALLNSIDGVDCVLIGARKEKYVDDALGVLHEGKVENAIEIFSRIKKELAKIDVMYTGV